MCDYPARGKVVIPVMAALISASIMGLVRPVEHGAGLGVWLAAVAWIVGASMLGTVACLRYRSRSSSEPQPRDDGEDDGGLRRPTPPPSPPIGPVSWPDFERDFAEYCASRKRPAHRD